MAKKSRTKTTVFSRAKQYVFASKVRLVGAAFAILVALFGGVYAVVASQAATIPTTTVTIGARSAKPFNLQVGFDYTHQSYLFRGNRTAGENVRKLLSGGDISQNVHINGFGTEDPKPTANSKYNWASLDERVAFMKSVPLERRSITLCCAAGWMTGNKGFEAAPQEKYYAAYAQIAADVATRYKNDVKYYVVWNELKGFGPERIGDFTKFYNTVYNAIKKANPNAKVGGPYIGMNTDAPGKNASPNDYGSVNDPTSYAPMNFWKKNRVGADFLTVDGGPQDKKGRINANGYSSGTMFYDAAKRVDEPDKELWWMEFYPATNPATVRTGNGKTENWAAATGQHAISITADNIRKAAAGGVNRILLWEGEGYTANNDNVDNHTPLWTNTSKASGGKATPFYTFVSNLHSAFPIGTPMYNVSTSNGDIGAMASGNKVLLIVRGNKNVNVKLDGKTISMKPYEVRIVTR